MNLRIFLILFAVFILPFVSLSAKDYDSTHEFPEVREPDKHRIYLRSMGLNGSGYLPVYDFTRNQATAAFLLSDGSRNAFFQLVSNQPGITDSLSSGSQRELEYRFKGKFRAFYEARDLRLEQDIEQQPVKLQERTQTFGVAYIHPFGDYFGFGATLRRIDLNQNTSGSRLVTGVPTSFAITLGASFIDYQFNASGYAPGLHLEWKPLRWFEIHLGQQYYSLQGKEQNPGFLVLPSLIGVSYSEGTSSYIGTKSYLDLLFRISSWFAFKYGYVVERYSLNYKNYLAASDQGIVDILLFSGLTGAQSRRFEHDAMTLTFEFSKSFGE